MSSIDKLKHLEIPLQEILVATNHFDKENYLGLGGFGEVHKGNSELHGFIAVKRLDTHHKYGQGDPEFKKEIDLLSQYKHENIVSLLGFCDEDGEKILVYKLESNGSLDKHLHSDDLKWIQRLRICLDAARGLKYLHDGLGDEHRILHRDVKSANILLDENWNAKISDFGLSRLGPANTQSTFLMTHACGTVGYIDPDYFYTGHLTQKSDVFSFGVVLFEVLCGRLACVKDDKDDRFFYILAQKHHQMKTLHNIIHPDLLKQINANSLLTYSTIAYQCLKIGVERPTMNKVVEQLEKALKEQQGHSGSGAENLELDSEIYSPHSSHSKADDDDLLPGVESLVITGEPLPGREIQVSGYSINGTTSCNFEWVRQMEDGSITYIEGAKLPNYLVNADDVDAYLAVEVQPIDDRNRKGEVVKVFANEQRKIVCDEEMQVHMRKTLQDGYAEYKLSLWTGYLGIWEPVTLVVKKDGFMIMGSGISVNEKFSVTTRIYVPCGDPVQFCIIGLGNVEWQFRLEVESAGIKHLRDIIVLTTRCFIRRAIEKTKVKKKGLFF